MPNSVFTDAYAAFIDGLIQLRKERGVTQVELARRLGRAQQFVSAVERRVRRLDVIELYAVLRALGAEPEKFVLELYSRLPARIQI